VTDRPAAQTRTPSEETPGSGATTASPAVRAGLLVAVLVALAAVAVTVDLPDVAVLRAGILAVGPLAPLTFVVGYALIVPLPVPKSVLTTLAGVAFGVQLGIPLAVAGATAGATLAFGIARALGRDAVDRLARGRLDRVDAAVERGGTLAAVAVRVVPVLPFTVLNYACGVTTMRLRHYVLGTALGLIPGISVMVTLASTGARISLWVPLLVTATMALPSLAGCWLWQTHHVK
jgi:uncharacterized membrane protein YdjX (TVP38/TMEM64 family)